MCALLAVTSHGSAPARGSRLCAETHVSLLLHYSNLHILVSVAYDYLSISQSSFVPLQYSTEFMAALMDSPALIRNVAICGHLHHGKTTLADLLIEQTHDKRWNPADTIRYTDTRKDEQQRGVSIKCTPVSLVMQVRLSFS